jgi:hypothetical protein
VTGIKTTVPLRGCWRPGFIDGRFHTTCLDEVLKARNGRPFVEAGPDDEIAVIAPPWRPRCLLPRWQAQTRRQRRWLVRSGCRRASRGFAFVAKTLMQYEVEIGGRLRQVVARTGDDFAVTVDGHTRQVDATRIDAHTLSLAVDSLSPMDAIKGPQDPRLLNQVCDVSFVRIRGSSAHGACRRRPDSRHAERPRRWGRRAR